MIFTRITNFKNRIKFKNPPKSEIVVFDQEGSENILKFIIYDIGSFVLHTRFEQMYVTPQVLFYFIINLRHIDLTRNGPIFRQLLRESYKIYLLSCLKIIKPRVVVTFIDNSYLYHSLSFLCYDASFYAIQNGLRGLNELNVDYQIFMQNLFCFGEYDIDLYKKGNHKIQKFYAVGSVKGSYYKRNLFNEEPKEKYDLCLISQWRDGIINKGKYPEIKRSLDVLNNYLSRYLKDRELKVCIATRVSNDNEIEYFKRSFGEKTKIIIQDRDGFSTYRAMNASDIIISFCSTAAVEAFGWGKKVLFCNFSGDKNYDLPYGDMCLVNNNNYLIFQEQLDSLRNISFEEYLKATRNHQKLLMNYPDEVPSYSFIRDIILKDLKDKQ